MNNLARKVIRGGVWAVLGRLCSAALGIAASLLVARLIPPYDMGVYFLASSAAAFLAVFSSFGLPVTAMRFIASREGDSGRTGAIQVALSSLVYGCALALVVAVAFAAGIGQTLAATLFNSSALESLTSVIAAWGFLLAVQNLITEICRGFHRIDLAVLSGGLLSGGLLAGVLLAGIGGGINMTLSTILMVTLLTVGLSWLSAIPLARQMWPWAIRHDRASLGNLFRTAWPIWLHGLAVFALMQGSIWIIGAFASKEDVAVYGVASRLAAIFSLVNGMVYAFLPPIIVQLNSRNDKANLQRLVRGTAAVAGGIMLPALALCLLIPERLLSLMFGDYYVAGSVVLMALSFANFFNLITGMRGYLLLVCGYERLQLAIALVGGSGTLFMVYFGVSNWGISAAAIGACIGLVFQCAIEVAAVRMRFGIWTFAWCSRADLRSLLEKKGRPSTY